MKTWADPFLPLPKMPCLRTQLLRESFFLSQNNQLPGKPDVVLPKHATVLLEDPEDAADLLRTLGWLVNLRRIRQILPRLPSMRGTSFIAWKLNFLSATLLPPS